MTKSATEAERMTNEEILRMVCEHTGKRISLHTAECYEHIDFARAIEKRVLVGERVKAGHWKSLYDAAILVIEAGKAREGLLERLDFAVQEHAARAIPLAAAEPVAWGREVVICDDAGYAIGRDEPEVIWGAKRPEDDLGEERWTPLYAAHDRAPSPTCHCEACEPQAIFANRMILCATCGNKRCPHATDHRNVCTGSNEPGQRGSSYENCGGPDRAPSTDSATARLLKAAETYAMNWCQDEAEPADDHMDMICTPQQHAEATELFAAIAAMKGEA